MISPSPPFEQSVFINCPFEEDYAPLLQAIAFCVTGLDFYPRLAPEKADNAANRLDRVVDLVRGSKYGIHDLNRCRADVAGDYACMNMPFELGVDHGCARYGDGRLANKAILVLEHTRFDYQKALSDIAGWDISAHGGDHLIAVRHVRDWLLRQTGSAPRGTAKILSDYADFQE